MADEIFSNLVAFGVSKLVRLHYSQPHELPRRWQKPQKPTPTAIIVNGHHGYYHHHHSRNQIRYTVFRFIDYVANRCQIWAFTYIVIMIYDQLFIKVRKKF